MAWSSYFPSAGLKQTVTGKHMTRVVFVAVLFCFIDTVECRVCTRMTMDKKTVVDKNVTQCTQSYQASCGWFSSEMCTFYEKVMCIKESNRTVTIYRIVEECCPGYTKDKDGGCVRVSGVDIKVGTSKNPAVPAVTVEPMDPYHVETVTYDNGSAEGGSVSEGGSGGYNSDDDDDGKFFLGLSHGAYAGIVCGILFVACVALLTALHYRKRKQRQKKMSTINMEQDVTQQQQMLPMQRMDTEPVPT